MERISKNKYKTNKTQKKEKKDRKKLTKKQKILIAIGIIFLVLVVMGIVLATYIYKADGNIANAALNMMADIIGDDTPITVLVLGISEGISVPLTDTILLCGYNPQTQQAFMLSIPRDTYIGTNDNYADGYSKINSAYQKGIDNTIEEVEDLTGVEINHYVVVKTSALVEIVDAIGGVNFDVPIDMEYDDPTQNLHINLKAGMQLIDGAEAEQLLRFRHNNDGTSYPSEYGDNDYGRMKTQREFIKATIEQVIEWDNISKIKDIASAIFDNLETDMSLSKLIAYIPSALEFNMENIQTEQLPGSSEKINGLWFYTHNLSQTKNLMTELMTSLGLEESVYNELYTPISTVSKRVYKQEDTEDEENTLNTAIAENTTFSDALIAETTVTTQTSSNTNVATCTHTWTESKIITAATCISGLKELVCSSCGVTTTENISATETHSWVETSREVATIVAEGTIYYKCSKCGSTKTESIPKLEEPVEKEPSIDVDNTFTEVDTSSSSNEVIE